MYSVLPAISNGYPHLKGRSPTCYSPVRHSRRRASSSLAVRLACLRRAASVRSEPGSNSPLFYFKHPEGHLISYHNSEAVPFLIFLGTLTFGKKENTRKSNILTHLALFFLPLLHFSLRFSYLRLLCLSNLLSLPFIFKDLICLTGSFTNRKQEALYHNLSYLSRAFCTFPLHSFSHILYKKEKYSSLIGRKYDSVVYCALKQRLK